MSSSFQDFEVFMEAENVGKNSGMFGFDSRNLVQRMRVCEFRVLRLSSVKLI
jgi:hypothetical protein